MVCNCVYVWSCKNDNPVEVCKKPITWWMPQSNYWIINYDLWNKHYIYYISSYWGQLKVRNRKNTSLLCTNFRFTLVRKIRFFFGVLKNIWRAIQTQNPNQKKSNFPHQNQIPIVVVHPLLTWVDPIFITDINAKQCIGVIIY